SFAICTPAKFEPQKVEAGFSSAIATEGHDPRLIGCQFQSELLQSFCQFAVKASRFLFPSETTDEVVCIAKQEGPTFTTTLEHSLKPQIEDIVQVHIRQHWRDDATLRCSTFRSQHFSICVQHPGFQPLLNQAQYRLVINPFRQHPQQPLMPQIVEETFDVRFHQVMVAAELQFPS